MIKKLLVAIILCVSSLHATDSLEQWLESTNTRDKFTKLNNHQQECLKQAFAEFDIFLKDAQSKLEVLSDKHKTALQTIKDMLGVKTLSFSLSFAGAEDTQN